MRGMSTALPISPAPNKLDILPARLSGLSERSGPNTLKPDSGQRVSANAVSSTGDPLADLLAFSEVVFLRRKVRRGEVVFQAGDSFAAIYAIRSGFFKTTNMNGIGHKQVMGFFMRGELFGLEGVGSGYYEGTASALEDSEMLVLPFALLESLSRENKFMQRQLHMVLAREITRHHGLMLLLGAMTSEERVATFLVNLSMRFAQRGYSRSEFILRMSREEIGSYLGLRLETVSRRFGQFCDQGLLEVRQRCVRILNPDGLRRVIKQY